jgi:hypothetical protein
MTATLDVVAARKKDKPAQPGGGRRDGAGGVGVAGHRSGDAVVYSHRSELYCRVGLPD